MAAEEEMTGVSAGAEAPAERPVSVESKPSSDGNQLAESDEPAESVASAELIEEIFGSNTAGAYEYHELLATDGSQRGFIGPREVPRLWQRHILNCAVIHELCPRGARIVDVGSGAGLPGIPLALARPDLNIILLEPLLKRSTFLLEATEKLGLRNVTVVRGRAEDKGVRREIGHRDIVTSRAVAPLGKLALWSLPLVHQGGLMLSMKGETVAEELQRDRKLIKKAGGGKASILTIGAGVLEEPATVIRIPRVR